ncbi:MAG: sensor histidine kinase [Myxococcales bacterium]|nr:sensor histidine kinase [Myxococcales bacterium]
MALDIARRAAATLAALIASPSEVYLSLSDEDAMRAHTNDVALRNGRLIAWVTCAANVLWWVADRGALPPRAQATVGALRAVILAMALLQIVGLYSTRPGRFHPMRVLVPTFAVDCVAFGFAMGRLGSPSTPWPHMMFLTVLIPTVTPVPLLDRALYVVGGLGLLAAGYLCADLSYVRDPMFGAWFGYLVFSMLVGVAAGETIFGAYRAGFRNARALASLAKTLDARVLEKTAALRSLVGAIEQGREAERRRIASEMHDELGQQLGALRYAVDTARERYRRDPASITQTLETVAHLLSDTGESVRRIVNDLRPTLLTQLGLGASITWLARRCQEASGVECVVSVDEAGPALDERVALAAFRVAQEALTNALQHAKATKITVAVAVDERRVCVEVADNGVGISSATPPPGHFGLLGMRERAAQCNATLDVSVAPSGGTRVRFEAPRDGAARQDDSLEARADSSVSR